MKKTTRDIVEEVFALYAAYGNADYIGEPVSQLEHMSQAAQLAESEGYPPEVILAAFSRSWTPFRPTGRTRPNGRVWRDGP